MALKNVANSSYSKSMTVIVGSSPNAVVVEAA